MSRSTMLMSGAALAASLLLIPGPAAAYPEALAQKKQTTVKLPTTVTLKHWFKLICWTTTPVEFPNNLTIKNTGLGTVPAGTRVRWTVQGNSSRYYTFAAPLAPNGNVWFSMGFSVEAHPPCSVVVTP